MNSSSLDRLLYKFRDRVRKFGQLITTKSDLDNLLELFEALISKAKTISELGERVALLEKRVADFEARVKHDGYKDKMWKPYKN